MEIVIKTILLLLIVLSVLLYLEQEGWLEKAKSYFKLFTHHK